MSRRLLLLSFCALGLTGGLAGCANKTVCPPPDPAVAGHSKLPDWHDVITDPDHERLRAWRQSLVNALNGARAAGHGAEIDKAGVLLDPDAGVEDATLPVGFYNCQVVKLGAKAPSTTQYVTMPMHRCEVRPSDDITRLIQRDGLQRPSGRLYPDGPSRMIFLGTMVLADETLPIVYGRDADRNMVGVLQRIGDKRWRMLLPSPSWEAQSDVMDLTPAPAE
jgi:hypothetical protein